MARLARFVAPGMAHHVTQRGSRRGDVFFEERDYPLYLNLLKKCAEEYGSLILSYCLMPNHIHLVLVPNSEESLSKTVGNAHSRYANVVNGRMCWTGHLWQERFFSSVLDDDYLWTAIRYVERNPVAARMVDYAQNYKWSSAASRCNLEKNRYLLSDQKWDNILGQRKNWGEWLRGIEDPTRIKLLKARTRRDLPTGSDSFIEKLESEYGVKIMPKKRGRPKKS